MTVTVTSPATMPTLAPPAPRRYGASTVAHVVDSDDGHWQQGVQVEASPACLTPGFRPLELCPAPAAKGHPSFYNVLGGTPWYGFVLDSCKTVGMLDSAQRRARSALESYDDYLLGGIIAATLDAFVPGYGPGTYEEVESLAEHTIGDTIAAMEQLAAHRYLGQPTLWVNPGAAVVATAQHVLFPDGGVLRTAIGTPVGLLPDLSFSSGLVDVWMTGDVTVYRSPVAAYPVTVDLATNDYYALAERVYVPIIDCLVLRALGIDSPGICCPAGGPI